MINRSTAARRLRGHYEGKLFLITVSSTGCVKPTEFIFDTRRIDLIPCFYTGERVWNSIRSILRFKRGEYYSTNMELIQSDPDTWRSNVNIFILCMKERYGNDITFADNIKADRNYIG